MIDKILNKEKLNFSDIEFLLNLTDELEINKLLQRAYEIKEKYIGKKAYYRGLIEISNICDKNCYYCGIRKGANIKRYTIVEEEILEMAKWAYKNNYASITLQAGEITGASYTKKIANIIRKIKELSNGELGITLSLGEQSYETYKEWFLAGAHRYLLRIETSDKDLYKTLHPNDDLHSFDNRIKCLKSLKDVGYQVGTGVMVGLPNQTVKNLVNDILFFEKHDIDMLGMGPYVVANDTPTAKYVLENGLNGQKEINERFILALKFIATCRLYLKDVNIAASTAMEALAPKGRERALLSGANILMPVLTKQEYKKNYQLYDNKTTLFDETKEFIDPFKDKVEEIGEKVGFGEWGDSPHFNNRKK